MLASSNSRASPKATHLSSPLPKPRGPAGPPSLVGIESSRSRCASSDSPGKWTVRHHPYQMQPREWTVRHHPYRMQPGEWTARRHPYRWQPSPRQPGFKKRQSPPSRPRRSKGCSVRPRTVGKSHRASRAQCQLSFTECIQKPKLFADG